MTVDANGSAYVTGYTESADFPTTAGAFQQTMTFGHDGFLAKLNAAGTGLVYATYFGALGTQGSSVAVDAGGSAYVAGFTIGNTLPVTAGAVTRSHTSTAQQNNDAYLLKFSPGGASVSYGTYIAGSRDEAATGVAVDSAGHAVVTGWTTSLDLLSTAGAAQPLPNSASFRSTDGGQTFAPDNGGILSTEVDAIAIDPQQPSNVYEASRDAGILKSTDGGATWSRVFFGPAFDLAINPVAPSTIFAIASNGGSPFLARTIDAGAHWTVVLPIVARVAIAASSPSTLYVVRAGGDVSKSTDNGDTWTTVLASAGAGSIAVDPANASIAYVGVQASQIRKTADGGATWTTLTIPTPSPQPVDTIAVDPTMSSALFASVQGRFYMSTNGGAGWSQLYSAAGNRIAFDGSTIYVSAFEGAVLKTTDRFAHWTFESLRGNAVTPLGLAAHDGVVFVGIAAHKDAFAWKIDTNATTGAAALLYGTFIGGTLDDAAVGVGLDPAGNAVVGLQTASHDLPITAATAAGERQMAVARLSPDGSAYTAFTYTAGGSSYTFLSAIAVDRYGYAYTTGIDGDGYYLWIEQVDATGISTSNYYQYSPAFMTANGIAADGSGGVYVTGDANGGLNTTAGAAQPSNAGGTDGYVEKASFAATLVDLARGRPAVASSIQAPEYAAANAVDGDSSTRWSSQWSDPQWIYVDLGQRVQLDHVVLRWETAYGSEYAIQVSDDAQSWGDSAHTFSRGGTDVLTFTQSVTGRYVRMYGYQRGTQWGYSLWSFEVYGTPVANQPPPPPPPGPNIALHKPVVVSSIESAQYGGKNATDGNMSTRWSSQFSDPQWIYVDLGDRYSVTEVILHWETAFGADYTVDMSSDAKTWYSIASVTGGDGGGDTVTGLNGIGRYLRINGTRRGTQ